LGAIGARRALGEIDARGAAAATTAPAIAMETTKTGSARARVM
jgi:hypothetical protein